MSYLRRFLANKYTDSFTAAAAAVYLSHSSVSIQMNQLEQYLGPRAPERRVMLATPRHCQRQTLLHCLADIAKTKTGA